MTKTHAIIVLLVYIVNIVLAGSIGQAIILKKWKVVILLSLYFIITLSINAYTVHYYNMGWMDLLLVKLGWINMDQVNYYTNRGFK